MRALWLSKLSVKRVSSRTKAWPVVVRPTAHEAGDPTVAQLPVLVEHPPALVRGDEQGGAAVRRVRDPLDEPELHEVRDLPAHRRGVGVHRLGERSRPAGPVLHQVNEQQIGCAVDGVRVFGLVLGLNALDRRTRRTSWLPISSAVRSSSVVVTSPPEALLRASRKNMLIASMPEVDAPWPCGSGRDEPCCHPSRRRELRDHTSVRPHHQPGRDQALRDPGIRASHPVDDQHGLTAHAQLTPAGGDRAQHRAVPAADLRLFFPDIRPPQVAALIHSRCGGTHCPGGSPATQRAFTLQTTPTNGRPCSARSAGTKGHYSALRRTRRAAPEMGRTDDGTELMAISAGGPPGDLSGGTT